jgi:hypothetical protein
MNMTCGNAIDHEHYIKSRSVATFLLSVAKHRFISREFLETVATNSIFQLMAEIVTSYTMDAKTPLKRDNLIIKASLISDPLKCLLQYTDVSSHHGSIVG